MKDCTPEFNSNFVLEPSERDILCGQRRSNGISQHPGNRLLRRMIENFVGDFEQANTMRERTLIYKRVIKDMRQKHGARFLRQHDEGGWALLSESQVRDKVSHAIRFAAQQRKRKDSEPVRISSSMKKESDDFEGVPYGALCQIYHRQQLILKAMTTEGSG